NSTPTPTTIDPDNALIARADERLAHAYEQIARADEQIARVTEQLSKMEHETAPPPSAAPSPSAGLGPSAGLDPSAGPVPQTPTGRPALRSLVGLLAFCFVVAALVAQASYGGAIKPIVARWAPQLVSTPSLPPENPPPPAQIPPSPVQVAAADAAPVPA